jgi:hypothetical protein
MKINHPDSPCSAPAGSCGLVARLASVAFMLLPFLPANAFELDLRTARIEANAVNESQKRAINELEKHLSMIASARALSPKSVPAVFVLGRPAPGCAEAGEHEALAKAVDGKIYFWGDDTGRYTKPPKVS